MKVINWLKYIFKLDIVLSDINADQRQFEVKLEDKIIENWIDEKG